MTKQCVICGNDFEPGSNRQKYCVNCGLGKRAICQQCGKDFIVTPHTTGKYCSRDCRNRAVAKPGHSKRACTVCGKEFKSRRKDQLLCSKKCAGTSHRRQPKPCPVCGKLFLGKYTYQVTCSRQCSAVLKRGERNEFCERCGKPLPFGKNRRLRFCSEECRQTPIGTRKQSLSGYVYVRVGNIPGANSQGYMAEHRLVMSQQLDRDLEKHERVHHKNGNRADNRPENLELWTVGFKDPHGVRVNDAVIDRFTQGLEIIDMDNDMRAKVLDALKQVLGIDP